MSDDLRMLFEETPKEFYSVKQREDVMTDIWRGVKRAPAVVAGLPGEIEKLLQKMGAEKAPFPLIPIPYAIGPAVTPESPQVDTMFPDIQDVASAVESTTGISMEPPQHMRGRVAEVAGTGGLMGLGRTAGRMLGGDRTMNALLGPPTAETVIGGGAGLAGEMTGLQGFPRMGIEALGGLGTAGLLGLATRSGRSLGAAFAPATSRGRMDVAGDILKDAIQTDKISIDDAVRILGENPVLASTVPQMLDSPTMNAVLRGLKNENSIHGIGSRTRERTRNIEGQRTEQVLDTVANEGDVALFHGQAKDTMNDFRARMRESINRRIDDAEREIRDAGGNVNQETLSLKVSEKVDESLNLWNAAENKAWESVKRYGDVPIGEEHATAAKTILKRVLDEESGITLASEKLPKEIVDSFNKINGNTTLNELQALRSSLLNKMRKARGGSDPDFDLARRLNVLTRSNPDNPGLLDILADVGGDDIQSALKISLAKNETFQSGPVARMLGLEKTGADRISPLSTLDEAVGSRTAQGQNIDAIRSASTGPAGATGTRVASDDAIEEYLRTGFTQDAMRGGEVSAKNARAFIENNNRALSRYPVLKQELETATATAERALKEAERRTRTLKAQNDRSMASRVFGSDIDDMVVNAKLKTANDYREFLRLAGNNRQARRGGERAIVNHILKQSIIDDGSLTLRLDPKKLNKQLVIFRRAQAEGKPIIPSSRLRILEEALTSTRKNIELDKVTPPSTISLESESPFLTFLLRIGGARVGAAFGGRAIGAGQIQAAGAGSRFMERLIGWVPQSKVVALIEEAMFDPEVARTLLMRPTKQNQVVILKRIRGHLADIDPERIGEQETSNQ